MRTFTKQPWETWDYDIEMFDWFNFLDDEDFIANLEFSCVPPFGVDYPDLVLGPDTQPDWQLLPDRNGLLRRGKVWIGRGSDKVDYVVTMRLTTDLGRKDETEFKIRVRETP
jgi:hypothetical protein